MCGICGFAGTSLTQEAARARLQAMCAVMVHRGPDSDGFWHGGSVGLGMRRLRVIDLETGEQPIANESNTIQVVCNGEIYNYRRLRRDLEAKGHRFRTKSDVEVLVHLYEEGGEAFVRELEGMFAFALYDGAADRLILGRDRLGIKPLYYYWDGRRLVFGSTVQAIVADPSVPRRLDPAALCLYCSLLYIPEPASIFRDVRKLPPGHLLIHAGGSFRLHRYWDVEEVARRAPGDDSEAELRALLKDVVQDHLVSDVPLGVFLSGGVDSSAVVAMMALGGQERIKTFSIGFEEEEFNELHYARLVSRAFGTDHCEVVLRPDVFSMVDRVVDHLDEPMGDASCIPTYLVSQVARSRVTVVLSGDGGDELFGGYDRYHWHRLRERYRRLPDPVRRALRGAAGWGGSARLSKRVRSFLARAEESFPRSFYHDSVNITDAIKAEVLHPDLLRAADSTEPFERLRRPTDTLDNMQLIDLKLYLPDDILFKVDRMSMAHSLEARVPLLDHRFVEFCYSLPSSVKIHGNRRKHIFKNAMRGVLPPEILRRGKRGFGIPLNRWFRAELRDPLRDVLQDRRTRERGWFNAPAVDAAIAEHLAGVGDRTNLLWGLFVLELWSRKTLDGAAAPAPAPAD